MVQSFTAGQRLTAAELNAIAASNWSPITWASGFAAATGGAASESRFINSNTVLLIVRFTPTAATSAGSLTVGTVTSSMAPNVTVSGTYAVYGTNTCGMVQISSAGSIILSDVPALTTSSVVGINICYGTDM